jgi:hypothetical protein
MGSRRSVSIAPPQAGRGTDCPRRGVQYQREGCDPKGRDPASRLRDLRGSVSDQRIEPDRLRRTRKYAGSVLKITESYAENC